MVHYALSENISTSSQPALRDLFEIDSQHNVAIVLEAQTGSSSLLGANMRVTEYIQYSP